MITSIHTQRGRAVKLKSIRYQLADDILLNINFDSHLWQQCIQVDAIRYKDFHNIKSLREKDAIPPHSVTIEHPWKQGKLNGVSKIFSYLFDLNKYTLITTIHFMVDDVEASWYFQTNGFNKFGVPYCLTLKLISKHSIDSLLQDIQLIIIIHNKDWHDRVTYKTILGTFSFSLVYGKKLRFSSNIYLLSLLLDQFSPGKSFVIQSQIKDLFKMENISIDHKE